MQQLIAVDHIGVGIAKQGERVPFLAAELLRNIRWIDTDRDRANALLLKFRKTIFDASQLEVAVRSPVSAIEN